MKKLKDEVIVGLAQLLAKLTAEDLWLLGDLMEFNSAYCHEQGIEKYALQELEDGHWVLAKDGDYHQENEYPLMARKREVLEAFRFATAHDLYNHANIGEHQEQLPTWHRKQAELKERIGERELKDIRASEQGLTNPIIGSLPIPELYTIEESHGRYAIAIANRPLKYFERIGSRVAAEYLLLALFVYQAPAVYVADRMDEDRNAL